MNKGIVYLLVSIDANGDECHKIGVTKRDVKNRIRELQTGNSNEIRLLEFYESDKYNKIENLLHKKLSKYKTIAKNEWFNLPQEIILDFKNECKKIEDMIIFLEKNNTYLISKNGKF